MLTVISSITNRVLENVIGLITVSYSYSLSSDDTLQDSIRGYVKIDDEASELGIQSVNVNSSTPDAYNVNYSVSSSESMDTLISAMKADIAEIHTNPSGAGDPV